MQDNIELVQKGFHILLPQLAGYIGREMTRVYKDGWWQEVLEALSDQNDLPENGDYGTLLDSLDMANCLRLIDRRWRDVFSQKMSRSYRNWASELMGYRNTVAHAGSAGMNDSDTERALDTMARFCEPIDGEATEEIRKMLVPKAEELIATPYRHDGNAEKAKDFFEDGMLATCKQIYQYAREDIPVTIYYAYKQSDADSDGKASSGWETMLQSIIMAGFTITGTWPVRTEKPGRTIGIGTNALASSIVLVCRKRPEDAPQTTRRNLIASLRRELRPALQKLQASNIAPVDLAQSAIGPGMGVFSRFQQVLEADGTPMTVRSALKVINEEIDLFFNEQVGDLDSASRFCVDLYTQYAYNDVKYGEAEVLANAKSVSIPALVDNGVVYAKAGHLHLMERTELPRKVNDNETNIWLLAQQLTQNMAEGGVDACARIVYNLFGSNAERAKDLAYRLYTIAEQKKWTNEAYAYNALVVSWPDIQSRAAELKAAEPEALDLFAYGLQ